MSNDMKKLDSCMHFQGGKLQGINTKVHILYEVLRFQMGLNPSEANPKRTFRESEVNSGNSQSKFFQPSASARCHNTSSVSTCLSLCHLMSDEPSCNTNNHSNLGINGKWHNTLCKKKISLY